MDADDVAGRATYSWTAKSCGPGISTLMLRFAETIRATTVTKSPITGESTKETVKTIAQGVPECFGEPVVTTLVCFHLLHTRLRVRRALGIPCALCLAEATFAKARADRAAGTRWLARLRCLKIQIGTRPLQWASPRPACGERSRRRRA
jgi:hypothetical protein